LINGQWAICFAGSSPEARPASRISPTAMPKAIRQQAALWPAEILAVVEKRLTFIGCVPALAEIHGLAIGKSK
jgi:hypothetical protein